MIKISPKLFWLLFSLSVLLKRIYADESQNVSKKFRDYLADLKHFCQKFCLNSFWWRPQKFIRSIIKVRYVYKKLTLSTQAISRKSYSLLELHLRFSTSNWYVSGITKKVPKESHCTPLTLIWIMGIFITPPPLLVFP